MAKPAAINLPRPVLAKMRVISWNCNMAFRRKNAEILKYKPDILIIQECENKNKLKFGNLTPQPNNFSWFGNNENKGIGIFSYSDYKLNLIEFTTKFKYVIPFEIKGKINFNLCAIWAMDNQENRDERYIAQVWLGINYFSKLLNEKTLVVGDFNSNKIWDYKSRIANHSDFVNYLSSKNIFSLYHTQYNENQGEESKPTLYMHRNITKPYHVDYCFASNIFIQQGYNFIVGNYNDWIKFSDHYPIIIDINEYLV